MGAGVLRPGEGTATEVARDGLLHDYTCVTEENVELRCTTEVCLMDDGITLELDRLRAMHDRTREELCRRAAEIVKLRRAADDARAETVSYTHLTLPTKA